jgi:carbon storage regulator
MDMGNLVLTRRIGQKIMIGNDTVLEIVDIDNNEVRLSFIAPINITIHREEIFERINSED